MTEQQIQQDISKAIQGWLVEKDISFTDVQLERSADMQFGEYTTNVALRSAKELKRSPLEIAGELAEFLQEQNVHGVAKVEAVAPGFVNLFLNTQAFTDELKSILERGEAFGSVDSQAGVKWVIEHTSPNPNKAMHLGHLRNNLVGMGLIHLLQFAGANVVSDCVYNDRGIAIAKVMYGFLVHMRKSDETEATVSAFADNPEAWKTPEELEMKSDEFIAECYVKAEQDYTADEKVEEQVRQMVVDWEADDDATWKLWRHVLQYAYLGNERILSRLGSHWDKVWYEHEHYKKGKEYVETGLEKNVLEKTEDGAVVTKLEEQYNMPETIVLKRDGTSLYITQDLALTDLKKKEYGANKLVWVVGPEQSLAFHQLFAVCEQLGIGAREDFNHVTYGYVGLKAEDGSFQKMSSRAGTVVLIDDVIDAVKTKITERLEEDGKTDTDNLAEKLALAAVKFSFLKSDRTQDMTFDLEQSLDIQGDSGMYVLYTFVRTQSILRKAGMRAGDFAVEELGEEHSLVRTLLYFPDVVKKSVDDLSVHHVAQYLLEVASEFNSWYAKEMILDETEREAYKLAVTKAVGITLQNGLKLLGIETVDEI